MEYKISLFFSDLTYEKQEEIEDGVYAELLADENERTDAREELKEQCKRDEEEITKEMFKYRFEEILRDKARNIIMKTFNGDIEVNY